MANGTKFTTRDKKTGKVKRIKPTKSMVKDLTKVKSAIKKLTKVSYDRVQMKGIGVTNQGIISPYFIYHLNNQMSSWTPVFGYDGNDFSNVNKCYVNSYKVDARLTQDNESDLIWYTMFIVSLKDDAADSTTFDPATGALTLSTDTHYTVLGAQGKALINPRMFNIHAYKRFSMGGRAGDQSNPVQRDLSFTIVPKQKQITNPRGNIFAGVGSLSFPKDPSKNYYMILFNDDSAVDLATNKITINLLADMAIPN